MNIYDKFPIQFVRWAVNHNMNLQLEKDYIDLNTGMKSHCHLYYEDGKYVAKMRYDEQDVIETFNDLHYAVRRCEHGSGYMNNGISYLYYNGFDNIDDWEKFK